jgi:hypothetical protein
VSVGWTAQEALDAMQFAWTEHVRNFPDADPSYFNPDDVTLLEIPIGRATRDGDLV